MLPSWSRPRPQTTRPASTPAPTGKDDGYAMVRRSVLKLAHQRLLQMTRRAKEATGKDLKDKAVEMLRGRRPSAASPRRCRVPRRTTSAWSCSSSTVPARGTSARTSTSSSKHVLATSSGQSIRTLSPRCGRGLIHGSRTSRRTGGLRQRAGARSRASTLCYIPFVVGGIPFYIPHVVGRFVQFAFGPPRCSRTSWLQ